MKITITETLDSNLIEHNQASKIFLFDNLLEHFAPLFYEETRKKRGQFSNNMAEVSKLRKIISEYHKHLLKLKSAILRESLKNKILLEIENLSKVKSTEKIKAVLVEILSTLDNQPIAGLEKRLTLLQEITKKRIRKVEKNEETSERSI